MTAPKAVQHTPGPWEVDDEDCVIGANRVIAVCQAAPTNVVSDANAARIVDCVNACEGMDDPVKTIADLRFNDARYESAEDKTAALLRERDLAVKALKECLNFTLPEGVEGPENLPPSPTEWPIIRAAIRAALAACGGEK